MLRARASVRAARVEGLDDAGRGRVREEVRGRGRDAPEHVDIELGVADRVPLLVELDAAGEVGAAEDEQAVGEEAAEHGRADDVELALDEREDSCARKTSKSVRRIGTGSERWRDAPMMSSTALPKVLREGERRGGSAHGPRDEQGAVDEDARVEETCRRTRGGSAGCTARSRRGGECQELTSESVADAHRELLGRKAEEGGERDDGRDGEAEDDGRRLVRQVEGPRDGDEDEEEVEPRVAHRVDEALAERRVLADGLLGLEEGLAEEGCASRLLLVVRGGRRRGGGAAGRVRVRAVERVDDADLGRAALDLGDRVVVELGGRVVAAAVGAVEVRERRGAHLAPLAGRGRGAVALVDGGGGCEGLEEAGAEGGRAQLSGGVQRGRGLARPGVAVAVERGEVGRGDGMVVRCRGVGMATYTGIVEVVESFNHSRWELVRVRGRRERERGEGPTNHAGLVSEIG